MNTPPEIHLLRILLPLPGQQTSTLWAGFDDRYNQIARCSCDIHALPSHKRLEVIVPADLTAAHVVPIPANAGRHAPAIAAQALEDTLLGPREDTHITLGEHADTGRIAWVCSKSLLQQGLDILVAAGLEPDSAYSEYALLTDEGDTVAGRSANGSILFRTVNGQYGSVDDPATLQTLVGDMAIQDHDRLFMNPRRPESVSLLSGSFAPRKRTAFDPRQLRRSGWLLLALCTLLLVGALLRWQQLAWQEKTLKDEIRQTFAALYPGTPIVDPALQWESKRRELNRTDARRDALDQLSQFAQTLGAGLRPRNAEVRNGVVRLVLNESDVAKLRPRLQSDGRDFNITPAESGFSRLEIRMEKQ